MKLSTLITVVFVLRWVTQEARENIPVGYIGAMSNPPVCHIESVKHEERFDDEMEARAAMTSLRTNGIKTELFEVTEKRRNE